MLGLVRNSDLPLAERFAAAQAALPLVHPKLTSGHRTLSSLDAYGNGVAADNTKERANSDARVSPKTETGEQCSPRDWLNDVWSTMKNVGVRQIPVLDDDSRPLQIVYAVDAVRALLAEAQDEEHCCVITRCASECRRKGRAHCPLLTRAAQPSPF
jgi:hypothetical protein